MTLKQISKLLKLIKEKFLEIKKELKNPETKNGRKLYLYTKAFLGYSFVSDIDWDGDIDNEDYILGCAISFWNLFEKALGDIMTINLSTSIKISTLKTYNIFKSNPDRFKPIEAHNIREGDIVVAPTGYQGGKTGHIWICLENHLLASNNSYGANAGKFTQNYTLAEISKKWSFIRIFRIL